MLHIQLEVMTARVITSTPDTPIENITKLMVQKKVNRIPIVKEKRLVGIVTRGDILQAIKDLIT